MPHRSSLSLQSSLRKLLPRAFVEEQARACGAFQRIRKVDPFTFVWTIVLWFSAADTRTLAGFRRTHQLIAGQSLEESSFYRSEEHTSELQSRENLVCRLLLEK